MILIKACKTQGHCYIFFIFILTAHRSLLMQMRMEALRLSTVWILLGWMLGVGATELSCRFPAMYNFGDSNSDTGGMSAAFYQMAWPFGETFFHEAIGRSSDGRLIVDFIGISKNSISITV